MEDTDPQTCVEKRMLAVIARQSKALSELLATLTDRREERVHAIDSLAGEVAKVTEDKVFIVFEVDGKPLRQAYRKERFIGGTALEAGQGITLTALISSDPVDDSPLAEEELEVLKEASRLRTDEEIEI